MWLMAFAIFFGCKWLTWKRACRTGLHPSTLGSLGYLFAWPGMGTLILTAVGNRDYVIVQACLLLLVGVFIVVNLIADLSYGFLDPRIRLAADSRRT